MRTVRCPVDGRCWSINGTRLQVVMGEACAFNVSKAVARVCSDQRFLPASWAVVHQTRPSAVLTETHSACTTMGEWSTGCNYWSLHERRSGPWIVHPSTRVLALSRRHQARLHRRAAYVASYISVTVLCGAGSCLGEPGLLGCLSLYQDLERGPSSAAKVQPHLSPLCWDHSFRRTPCCTVRG